MTRKQRLKKVFRSLIITAVSFILMVVTVILCPQPLFANKVEYLQFKVYSNEKIGSDLKPVLDSVLSLVKSSELYDPTYNVDVFLSHYSFFNTLDDKVFGHGPSARTIDNNLVIKVAVDIIKNLAYPTFHKPCEQQLTYLIAHELTHCLQAHKYGMLKFNPLHHPAMWKLEGYPEYIARHKSFGNTDNLKRHIKRFVELNAKRTDVWISVEEGNCEVPEVYFKGCLMTEYLMNVVHYSYDQILQDNRSEEEIYSEMLQWATKQ